MPRSFLIALLTGFLIAFLFVSAALGQPEPAYQVTFKALTAFGDEVPIKVVGLADPLHHRDLASHCAGAVCSNIPEGAYSYSLAVGATARKVDGSAVIYRTNQVVAVDVGAPESDLDESSFPTIEGKVVNAADPAHTWIRMQQLYSDASVSAKIEPNGSFKLDEVRPGNWMLLVFAGGKLVHFEPYTCKPSGNTPLRIDLSSTQPVIKAETGRTVI